MKTGRTIVELAQEIERQKESRRDFIANTGSIEFMTEQDGDKEVLRAVIGPRLDLQRAGVLNKGEILWAGGVNGLAHDQIKDHVKIPAPYYRRMLDEQPALLAHNVNTWFHAKPEKRLARMLDGNMRAFLSDKFRPLENADLAEAIIPQLVDRKLDVTSCEITEKRLYIKAIDQQLQADVPKGHSMGDGTHTIFDTVCPAIIVQNSEVGCGRLVVETGIYTRACTNLALFSDGGFKKTHVGDRFKVTDAVTNIDHLLSDRAKRATDKALWLQVRDVVGALFDEAKFKKRATALVEAAQQQITGDIVKVVELAKSAFSLNEAEGAGVLKFLANGGDLSKWGLSSAITRMSQDVESYDRATELERLGGQVVELNRDEWRTFAEAA